MRAPCRGCKERAEGCHGRCERYAAYRAERDEMIRARYMEGVNGGPAAWRKKKAESIRRKK